MVPGAVQPHEDLKGYQQRAEAFWQAEVLSQYEAGAGLTETLSLAETYETYSDLFTLPQVKSLIEAAWIHADSASRYLAEFAAMRYLQGVVVPYDEAFFSQLGSSMISWEGKDVPFFATTHLLAAESSPEKRAQIYASRAELVGSFNSIRVERWQAINKEVPKLGYDSYYALCNELRGLRLASLQCLAEKVLAETAVSYHTLLAEWSQNLLGYAQPTAADMFYLLRGAMFDSLFALDRLETAVYETAQTFGINLQNQEGLELDLMVRPNKSPRPFCAFVQVPDQIKLVINPAGGHQDYRNAFHELGHALHGLHINKREPFALRYLGDDSVGEAYAFLFERLPSEPAWLREFLQADDVEAYVSYIKFVHLLFVRRCAAKVLYENSLHKGVDNPASSYADLLQTHLGLNISPAYYLLDVDDGFYNAQYFRAWILEAQMAQQLRKKVGQAWAISAGTGTFLRPFWAKGQPPAETISLLVGAESFNANALISEFI